jgi:hypothetical protein
VTAVGDGPPTTASLVACSERVPEAVRALKDPRVLEFYDSLLAELDVDGPLNILEVGVFRGGTILSLVQRLPRAHILGIDIAEPPAAFWDEVGRLGATDRVTIRIGSQTDREFLHRSIREVFGDEKLDMVSDDALHTYRGARPTFEEVFIRHLRVGGFYAIEDWGAGYFVVSDDGHPDGRRGLARLVKELIDEVALPDRTVAWKGQRSLRTVDRQCAAPISKAVITHGVAAYFRGEGDWLAPLDGAPWFDARIIRRDAERHAKRLARRLLHADG